MAVSRRLALFSLGTILLCFLITRAAVADSDHGDNVHVVRYSSAATDESEKAHQCRQENDDVDDDFDDTYKIVNNIAITLSASGRILKEGAA